MWSDLVFRLRALVRRDVVEAEMDEELRFHFEQAVSKYETSGLPHGEAVRRARMEFGGLEQVKEECREARGVSWVEAVMQDLRYGLRQLRRSPGFATVAVITLALGIGATTAIFSVVYAVLLKPLPYPDSDRLASLAEVNAWGHPISVSYPDFEDWRRQNHSFASMAAYGDSDLAVSTGEMAMRAHIALVTHDFFNVVGTRPRSGREFLSEEHKPNGAKRVIISDPLWRGLYDADPRVLGRTIKLFGGIPFTIVGVMPPGFDYPNGSQAWITAELPDWGLTSRTAHNFRVIGKLTRSVNFSEAQEDIDTIARRIKREYRSPFQAKGAQVISL